MKPNLLGFEAQTRTIQWTLAAIFVVAVGFNYPWELAHAPLYVGMDSFSNTWRVCLLAALGDGLLVLLIFAVGWMALRRRDWFARPGVRGYLLMLAVGLVIGIGVELFAIYALKRWEYTARMPLVPWLGVGLTPIAQMVVLPPLIFRVVAAWRGRAVMNSAEGDSSIE
ncbi:MAG: hypothetical protein ACREEM_06765 [Blastocatellia bacterium]